jgi:hypothetical protein
LSGKVQLAVNPAAVVLADKLTAVPAQTVVAEAVICGSFTVTVTAVRVVLPNTGGTVVQVGYVQQTSETGSVNGLWSGSMTLRNTGDAVVI